MRKTSRIAVCIIAAVLITASVIIAGLYAKYITSFEKIGSVTFSANLADSMTIWEHDAQRLSDGSYALTADTVDEFNYILMPGVDVPKDPFIRIVNKSAVSAYLYVEVVSNLPDTVTYTLTENWLDLEINGSHNGQVYVYAVGGAARVLDASFNEPTVPILTSDADGNTLTVSQYFVASSMTDPKLEFYAYMAQTIPNKGPTEIFTENFITP